MVTPLPYQLIERRKRFITKRLGANSDITETNIIKTGIPIMENIIKAK